MQEMNQNDVIEIDLLEVMSVMLHRLWLILLCGVLAGGLAFALSAFVVVPQYESTTKIYILNKNENSSLTYSDTQLATQLTKDYEELVKCRYVLETVIGTCGLEDDYEELEGRVEVENAADTRIIGITVKDPDPVTARAVADCIRDVASEHIRNVTDVEAVNVVDEANLPEEPSEPSIPIWTAVGALLGLLLCAIAVFLRYMMDDTVKSAEDVEKYLGLSTLALVPVMEEERAGKRRRERKKKKERSAKAEAGEMTSGEAGEEDELLIADLDA